MGATDTAAAVLGGDNRLVVAEQVRHPTQWKRAGGVVVVASYHKSGWALTKNLMKSIADLSLVSPQRSYKGLERKSRRGLV